MRPNLSIQFEELGIEMPWSQRLKMLINYPMVTQQHKLIKKRSNHILFISNNVMKGK